MRTPRNSAGRLGERNSDEIQQVLDAIHGVMADIGMDDEFSIEPTTIPEPTDGTAESQPQLVRPSTV